MKIFLLDIVDSIKAEEMHKKQTYSDRWISVTRRIQIIDQRDLQ